MATTHLHSSSPNQKALNLNDQFAMNLSTQRLVLHLALLHVQFVKHLIHHARHRKMKTQGLNSTGRKRVILLFKQLYDFSFQNISFLVYKDLV